MITIEAFAEDSIPVGHLSTYCITMRKERGAYRLKRKGEDRQRIGRSGVALTELQLCISLFLLWGRLFWARAPAFSYKKHLPHHHTIVL